MDTAPAGSGPGAWLRNPGQLPGASKQKKLLLTASHTAFQGHRIHVVRYEFWLGVYVEYQPVGWPG